ncbi:FAD-dependent monooxygenase [Kitasatospora sp. HPMI-4]|uniref:FAD-dependent monooxygenase n=1 Tax=Kitasatospora sp. HPMI-4 TaxID=3448443 RepID=UPI003F1A7B4F
MTDSGVRSDRPRKALVIGAGIGGLTTAATLRSVGMDVEVYERATELRAAGSGLSVMSNATAALRSIGLDFGLERYGRPLTSYHVRTDRGELIREFPFAKVISRIGAPSVLITRPALQQALLEQVAGIPLVLGAAAREFEIDEDSGGVRVRFEDGREAHGDVLIGADGFNSVVRRQLAGPEEARESGYICWLGVIPFEHPRFTPGSVTHYWGSGRRFGLVDVGGGQVYWWGTMNMPVEEARDWRGGKADVERAFADWPEEVELAVRSTPQEAIIAVPSRDRAFLEHWGRGPVTLLGDAAHPMLTSLGQGSGMAVEDAVVLARNLASASDLPQALRRYEDERRERTRAMVAATRATSELEQSEGPGPVAVRDGHFRSLPEDELTRMLEESLTFG